MSHIEIAPFLRLEREAYANVMREAFNYVNQGWSEEESLKYIDHISTHDCVLGAKIDGVLVGFLSAESKEDHLFIDAIGTLPNYMKRGVAKELWEAAVSYAKLRGLNEVKMIADPTSIAFQWYRKLGFQETGWVELRKELKNL